MLYEKAYRRKRTENLRESARPHDPKEDFITQDPKNDLATEDPKENPITGDCQEDLGKGINFCIRVVVLKGLVLILQLLENWS